MARFRLSFAALFLGSFAMLPACDEVITAAGSASSAPPPAEASQSEREFPNSWYFPDRTTGDRHADFVAMEGQPMPELRLRDWIGEMKSTDDLKDKIIIVDFWATWCPPCIRAIPKNIELADMYRADGVVLLGIHDANRGWDRMPAMVEERKINYPVAIDAEGTSARAWRVKFWPTYAVVDHHGIVRAIGLTPNHVEDVVKKLVAEKKAAAASAAG